MDYIPTQAIADFLCIRMQIRLCTEFFILRCGKGGEGRSKIVLLHKAACAAAGSAGWHRDFCFQFMMRLTADEKLIYWVSEEVPLFQKSTLPTKGLRQHFPLRSEPLNEPLDTDT